MEKALKDNELKEMTESMSEEIDKNPLFLELSWDKKKIFGKK